MGLTPFKLDSIFRVPAVGPRLLRTIQSVSDVVRQPHARLDHFVKRVDIHTDVEDLTLFRLGKGGKSTHEFVELNDSQYYPPHRHHTSAARLLVVSGTGTILLDGQEHTYAPGHVFNVPPNAWHGFQVGEETVLLSKQTPPIYDAKTGHVDIEYQDVKSNPTGHQPP